jgi:hypothetical protein
VKIKQAISSAILVVLLTAPTAWGQDNIRAAMEAAEGGLKCSIRLSNQTESPIPNEKPETCYC